MAKRDLRKILKSLNLNAQYIGLREFIEDETTCLARDGKHDTMSTMSHQGLMIEVMVNHHLAYGACSSFDLNEILHTAHQVYAMAEKGSAYKIHSFDPEQIRPPHHGHIISPRHIDQRSWKAGETAQFFIDLSKKLQSSSKVISTYAMGILVQGTTRYLSSLGADWEQDYQLLFSNIGATASTPETGPQTRSTGHEVAQGGLEFFNLDTYLNKVETINTQLHELLLAPDCPSESMDLLLSPDQMYIQIHESIGHPLELDRILGDERNYAGWSFVQPSDFGKLQYGSKLLNISFDPTTRSEVASYTFDDTGMKASKEFLIHKGLLLRGLGGLESQARSGIAGVANARASGWNRPPTDRMANLNLEPGSSSLQEMIAQVERGVYMHTNRSWSIDDFRNKFQFGCEYAQLIEEGRLTKVVKKPNYRGISVPFWNKLKAVGNEETRQIGGAYYCGKAEPNQIIRVGHASPACLFSQVEVFGGQG